MLLAVNLCLGCGGRAERDGGAPSSRGHADPATSTSGDAVRDDLDDAGPTCPGLPYLADGREFCMANQQDFGGASLDCELDIPDPLPPSSGVYYEGTELVFTPNEGAAWEIPLIGSERDCDTSEAGGFYFTQLDALDQPRSLTLCPCSCAKMQEGGTLEANYSCLGGWPRAQ